MATAADLQIVPHQPASLPELRAADQGVADRPGGRSLRPHPPRLRRSVATLRRLVRRRRPRVPAGRAPHRRPLSGRPHRLRRQHRRRAVGHQRDLESPRVGEAGIALSGPGRARLSEGMEPAPRQAPAPGRRSHLRRARRHPFTAVQPRKRGRGIETPEQAAERAKLELALVAALSDAGLRRSEAGPPSPGATGSAGMTAEAHGATVAITLAAIEASSAIRPAGVPSGEKVFGLSESQVARRVKRISLALAT